MSDLTFHADLVDFPSKIVVQNFKNWTKPFLPIFENFDRDFGTLGMEILKIGLQIRTRRLQNRLSANFGKFS